MKKEEKSLIKLLQTYDFPGGKLGTKPSETQLRPVAIYITEKIVEYLRATEDPKVIELISAKTGKDWENYLENNPHKGLLDPKTLKNLLSRPDTSPSKTTLGILQAFAAVVEKEEEKRKHLKNAYGRYNVINTHNRTAHFQISNVEISEEGAFLSYLSRRHTVEDRKELEVELVGQNKILLTYSDVDCKLIFYASIGIREKPEFFQAPFLYNNDRGETMAGLAVFVRIGADGHFITPQRKLPALDHEPFEAKNGQLDYVKNIEQYLLSTILPITPLSKDSQPFNFCKDNVPGPSPMRGVKARFYDKIEDSLAGDFVIYFTERFNSVSNHRRGFHYTIGLGHLKIFKDEISGVWKCTMVVKKNRQDKTLEFKGHILNHQLNNSYNILLSMYVQPHNDRVIQLLFNIVNDHLLIGAHAISYSPPGALGSGTVVMVKIPDTEKGQLDLTLLPSAINAAHYNYDKPYIKTVGPIERNIITLLAKKEYSLVKIPSYDKLQQHTPLRYSGLYKVYSYAKGGNIRMSALKIYPNGSVEHRGVSGAEKPNAIGKAEMVRSIINITLLNDDNKRTGFMCIRVAEVTPTVGETYYAGTFSGVSRRNGEFPLASVILLAFVNKEDELKSIEPTVYQYHESYPEEELPDVVRKMFDGKTNNFTILPGVYNQETLKRYVEKDTLDYGKVYFQSACQELEKGNLKKVKKFQELAQKHGFKDVEVAVANEMQPKLVERAVCFKLLGEEAKADKLIQYLESFYPEKDWQQELINKQQALAEGLKKQGVTTNP